MKLSVWTEHMVPSDFYIPSFIITPGMGLIEKVDDAICIIPYVMTVHRCTFSITPITE